MERSMNYRNLTELHRVQAERLGKRPALRYKRYGLWHDLSWEDYREAALACGAALAEAGIETGDRVGLLAENSVSWLIADMGILAAGCINVPSHAPLTARQVQFQLADAGARWVFASNEEQLQKIRKVRAELPALEGVVIFDDANSYADALPLKTFLQRGRQFMHKAPEEMVRREAKIDVECLATIMYTSGTTGNPKGVMLTQGNILSNIGSVQSAFPRKPDCTLLNWLPFSHIYARTADHYLSLLEGLTICLAESPDTIVQNLAETQPTHMSSVPRFYEKVLTAVASPDVERSRKTLRSIFGPRIEWLSSGGAPLSRPVAEAFKDAGLLVLQGYGLTESSPVISFNRVDSHKLETVGQAIPGVEIKIAPDGEVLTRGPHVMKGYWNNPEATAEALQDGWLLTGDLGRIDADGFLSITGRKKELLVLSNGKKVVPTYIEGLLVADDCIDQAVICGEARPFLTALIVPNWDNLRRIIPAAASLDHRPAEELACMQEVRSFLQKKVDTALADVANWEKVKKFVVLPNPLTVAAEELTVSLKIRRGIILKKYGALLEPLYRGSEAEKNEDD
jgi:long-chain acyl-CoA synthetase